MIKLAGLMNKLQKNIKVASEQLKTAGHEDLSILLSLCADKLVEDGDKAYIQDAINTIKTEAEQRDRMVLCPKCKIVQKESAGICEKCKSPLKEKAVE
jgi:uncharacterized paraquat-inducible protein A